jgi:hypothetical protein
MSASNNTIVLKGKGHYGEGEANSAISPGMAVAMAADGKFDVPAGTQAETLKESGLSIAREDSLQGNTIDDAYADTDRLFYYECLRGDEVNALVKDGETIAVGDLLVVEAGGSGLFVEAAGTETRYQLKALEALSPSGSNGFVACRVL